MDNDKSEEDVYEISGEELNFVLWKTELNKDLLSFWKSMEE